MIIVRAFYGTLTYFNGWDEVPIGFEQVMIENNQWAPTESAFESRHKKHRLKPENARSLNLHSSKFVRLNGFSTNTQKHKSESWALKTPKLIFRSFYFWIVTCCFFVFD